MQFLEAQVTQSPNSEREIPIDLLIEIFSSLPPKTVAKLRCVSKLWRSYPVISNPVTGETISLPKVELKSSDNSLFEISISPHMGYDPINKQLKVLCIKFKYVGSTCDEHQVLTLKNGNHSWRTIQCKPHVPKSKGICIDGILYYIAGNSIVDCSMIVCFDVTSEKFSIIDLDAGLPLYTLINYKGKLGVLDSAFGLELWILEDAEKCVWSKKIYTLPPLLKNLYIVGMTNKGEVVLSMTWIVDLFYIYYFNLESNHVTRVRIQGFEVFRGSRVHTSLDYAENLTLM